MVPAYISLKPALLAFVGAAVRFEPALPGAATSIDVSLAPSNSCYRATSLHCDCTPGRCVRRYVGAASWATRRTASAWLAHPGEGGLAVVNATIDRTVAALTYVRFVLDANNSLTLPATAVYSVDDSGGWLRATSACRSTGTRPSTPPL